MQRTGVEIVLNIGHPSARICLSANGMGNDRSLSRSCRSCIGLDSNHWRCRLQMCAGHCGICRPAGETNQSCMHSARPACSCCARSMGERACGGTVLSLITNTRMLVCLRHCLTSCHMSTVCHELQAVWFVSIFQLAVLLTCGGSRHGDLSFIEGSWFESLDAKLHLPWQLCKLLPPNPKLAGL